MVTFVNASTGGDNNTTISVPWPAGIAAGDVALLFWAHQQGTGPTDPAGFTLKRAQDSTGNHTSRFLTRVLDGTESGNVILTVATINRVTGDLLIYRGGDGTTPVDGFDSAITSTATTTHANPSVTPTVANCVAVTAISERSTGGTTTWTQPSGYTKRAEATTSGGGMTITAAADDGLAAGRPAGTAVTPPVWTSGNGASSSNTVTWTVLLRPASATVVSASAALFASGTLTAAGAVQVRAVATLTATATCSASGMVHVQAAAALSANAALTADGSVTVPAAAALASSASLAAAGIVERFGAATLTAAGTLNASAEVHTTGAATLTADSALAAAAAVTVRASAVFTASARMSAFAGGTTGSAALSAAASMTVFARVVVFASASLTASAVLTGAAIVRVLAAADLDAVSRLTAALPGGPSRGSITGHPRTGPDADAAVRSGPDIHAADRGGPSATARPRAGASMGGS